MRAFVTLMVFTLGLILLSGCKSLGAQPTADQLNEEGVQLLTSSAGDPDQLRAAVAKFERAIAKEPTFVAAHVNKVNALVQLADYEAALEGAKRVTELSHGPEHQLLVCAIQEVGGLDAEEALDCYKNAALEIREASPVGDLDVNYVVALKLAESPYFSQAAQRFIRSLQSHAEREIYTSLLLEDGREDVLHGFVQPRPIAD